MGKVSLPFLGEYEVAPQDFFSTNTPYQLVRRQYIVEFLTISVWTYQPGNSVMTFSATTQMFCHSSEADPGEGLRSICLLLFVLFFLN